MHAQPKCPINFTLKWRVTAIKIKKAAAIYFFFLDLTKKPLLFSRAGVLSVQIAIVRF
jgi:hypothetical protein